MRSPPEQVLRGYDLLAWLPGWHDHGPAVFGGHVATGALAGAAVG